MEKKNQKNQKQQLLTQRYTSSVEGGKKNKKEENIWFVSLGFWGANAVQTWTLEQRSDVIRLLALIRNDVISAWTGPGQKRRGPAFVSARRYNTSRQFQANSCEA